LEVNLKNNTQCARQRVHTQQQQASRARHVHSLHVDRPSEGFIQKCRNELFAVFFLVRDAVLVAVLVNVVWDPVVVRLLISLKAVRSTIII